MAGAVFDGVTLLDVAGPSEVFAEANRFGADYEVMLYSADGQNVVSSTGMRFAVDAAAEDSGPLEIALVAGSDNFPAPGARLKPKSVESRCGGA